MIKALLFDVGDVLIDIDWQRGHCKMLGHMKAADGTLLTLEEIAERMDPGPHGSVWDDFGAGTIDETDFLDAVSQKTGFGGDRKILRTALTELFEPLTHRIALLNDLIGRQLAVVLVSDTNSMHVDHIFENIPVERRFYSHRIGHQKKNGKDIYEHVLRSLNVAPQNALMIDDRIKNKVGADEIGLNFLLIQKNEDLKAALTAYGI
jgi:FMN phosphatase YigB (HAD superfamily)